MDHLTNAAAPSAWKRLSGRALLRRLYTSNPFYVLSADLVFVGLRLSLETSGETFATTALMVALLGYTLLLATTACLLIRLGQVWDDVRTILLLVVAMFLAISVTFDETLACKPALGTVMYLGGLLFAVLVSEGLLRGIRLRLPLLFRVPYYLILALFFVYPITLTPLVADAASRALQWRLFGFSTVAGLVFLSLIPAIRRGPGYVEQNGSPWRYPLYPWVLFGLLAVAVCGRAFYLCVSFHFVDRSMTLFTIFGPYFLIPFLFAIDVLLLEAGLTSRNRTTQRVAVFAVPGIVALAIVGLRPDPVFQGFLREFQRFTDGTPLFWALVGATVFATYAAFRQASQAYALLTAALLTLSVVGPESLGLDSLVAPRYLPLVGLGLTHLWLGMHRESSGHFLVGALSLIGAASIGLDEIGLARYAEVVGFHLTILMCMTLAMIFRDRLSDLLRRSGAVLLAIACLIALRFDSELGELVRHDVVQFYPLAVVAVCLAYGYFVGSDHYFTAAFVSFCAWSACAGWRGYLVLRPRMVGLDWILVGFTFFAVAALISLRKAGLISGHTVRRFCAFVVVWIDGRPSRARSQLDA